MIWQNWLLIMIMLSSLVPGLIIFNLDESRHGWRTGLNLFGAIAKMVLVLIMILGIQQGHSFAVHFALLPGLDLVLR
ncbi:MAG: monovalent cation/H+ antiporter subunit D family protein, partial [Desulfobulbaceae bacterium]|nr:monovalent cation/H+ antiporter subunit D family protein [Desulfobulbaceae bacterium]